LILGGIDVTGPKLVMVSPHGNCSYLPYTTMGSGSLAAIAILEANYKDDLSEEEARKLGIEAVKAGILHDEGSGSNVDVCVINLKGVKMERAVESFNKRYFQKAEPYNFPSGRTVLLLPEIKLHNIEKIEIEKEKGEKMMIE